MQDKQNPDMLYALADYKQLVMAYKTKHAELVKAVAFWKTSITWLAALMLVVIVFAATWMQQTSRELDTSRRSIETLNAKISVFSRKISETEQALEIARTELAAREAAIQVLEKDVSAASKKLLEQLLPDGAAQPAGPLEHEGANR